MAYVVVRNHNGEVLLKTELKEAVTVGRARECAVAVKDPRVSREHCRIEPWGQGWRVKDLGSHNHTFINGRAVKEQVLADGDIIEVGKDKIAFYAGRPGRVRAADPVMAGLADAEASVAGASRGSRRGSDSVDGRSESSLFATRVVADSLATADETSVGRAQYASRDSIDRAGFPAVPARKGRPRWGVIVASALGIVGGMAAAWIAWAR